MLIGIADVDVAEHLPELAGGLVLLAGRMGDGQGIVPEVGQVEVDQ